MFRRDPSKNGKAVSPGVWLPFIATNRPLELMAWWGRSLRSSVHPRLGFSRAAVIFGRGKGKALRCEASGPPAPWWSASDVRWVATPMPTPDWSFFRLQGLDVPDSYLGG